jgi:hypothetical protein
MEFSSRVKKYSTIGDSNIDDDYVLRNMISIGGKRWRISLTKNNLPAPIFQYFAFFSCYFSSWYFAGFKCSVSK